MDRHEQRARPLVLTNDDLHSAVAMCGGDPCPAAVGQAGGVGIVRVHFHEWFGKMRRQPRAHAGARHSVPLVADAAGVETQRKGPGYSLPERRRLDGDESRFAIGREEIAVREKTFLVLWL